MTETLRVGTRGSKLALTQTGMVVDALRAKHPELTIQIVEIRTTGDKKQGTPRDAQSDKRDWIHELELALQSNEIDLAVHSGKDIPSEIAPGTTLSSVLARATPFDLFIPQQSQTTPLRPLSFLELPVGAIVGTASLRRRAQLLRVRPDLVIQEHRGNVPTRLDKLVTSSEMAGIVLAAAGIERLDIIRERSLIVERLLPPQFLPAINQGILAVQYRQDDGRLAPVVKSVSDSATESMFQAERAAVSQLAADCNSAIGVYASIAQAELTLAVCVLSHDGTMVIEEAGRGPREAASQIGLSVGKQLIARGAQKLLLECSQRGF